MAGENIQQAVNLLRCLQPELYDFMKGYVLEPTKVEDEVEYSPEEEILHIMNRVVFILGLKLRYTFLEHYDSYVHRGLWRPKVCTYFFHFFECTIYQLESVKITVAHNPICDFPLSTTH